MKWEKMLVGMQNVPPLNTEVLLKIKKQYPGRVVLGIRTSQKPDVMVITCYQNEIRKMDAVLAIDYFSHWMKIEEA